MHEKLRYEELPSVVKSILGFMLGIYEVLSVTSAAAPSNNAMPALPAESSAEVLVLLKLVLALFVVVGLRFGALSASHSLVCAIQRRLKLVRFVVLHASPDTFKLATDIVIEPVLDLLLGLNSVLIKVTD